MKLYFMYSEQIYSGKLYLREKFAVYNSIHLILNNSVMREYLKACGNGNLKDMTELKV
ncbi:hypothetical protein ACJDU8_04850 [Clostridium sp. WILCCON 0269]|uniref:Transposase n=1 Tax=Candidatus Clostridium eludens TaxID=3381663 RepID=A0ABW8SG00_9CLOT